jgi:FKBP-type peptidyl-prolyl cis-trans isomerase/tetratricopeptide (TPR) repeat protein
MSDDEMPQMPHDIPSDDEMDMTPPQDLPEGVKKEIIKEGEGWKKPKAGDEVTVHYVGTLESDGAEFDSSRSRDQPFVFTLGKGQVIKGWDLGVATMKQGEVAKFTLSSEYAYGEAGSPPKIPGGATLVFEVELLSWVSKDDLFQDGGAIKTVLKEGSGWKKPKVGDEVRLAMKCTLKDGSVIEEKVDFEYELGSGALGDWSKVVDKVLTDMNKGAEVQIACSAAYALGDGTPEGATVFVTLDQLYETNDVSFAKDKSLMKKQILEGEGYATPKEAAKVKLFVEAATDGTGQPLPGFTSKVLDFVCGNGDVCDALELAVTEMKKGEKATLTCSNKELCRDEQLGLSNIDDEKVVFTLQLVEFEAGKSTWDMSEEEKVEHGSERKEVGSKLFRTGRYSLALARYKTVIDLFNYIDGFNDDNKVKAKDLTKTSELNSAACQLKLKEFRAAMKHCENVLKEEPMNLKALFRRAQANFGLKEYMDCLRDLRRVLEVEPQNREARSLIKEAQAAQKADDQKTKGLFAKMCQGLGRTPSVVATEKPTSDVEMSQADDRPQESTEKAEVVSTAEA